MLVATAVAGGDDITDVEIAGGRFLSKHRDFSVVVDHLDSSTVAAGLDSIGLQRLTVSFLRDDTDLVVGDGPSSVPIHLKMEVLRSSGGAARPGFCHVRLRLYVLRYAYFMSGQGLAEPVVAWEAVVSHDVNIDSLRMGVARTISDGLTAFRFARYAGEYLEAERGEQSRDYFQMQFAGLETLRVDVEELSSCCDTIGLTVSHIAQCIRELLQQAGFVVSNSSSGPGLEASVLVLHSDAEPLLYVCSVTLSFLQAAWLERHPGVPARALSWKRDGVALAGSARIVSMVDEMLRGYTKEFIIDVLAANRK
jgi:hypothetical protein